MPERIFDLMTTDPVALTHDASLRDAAVAMRDRNIGDVVVTKSDGTVCGIVTDRDIVVRAISAGNDPATTALEEVCTHRLVSVSPNDPVAVAVKKMEEQAIRRLPVMDDGTLVGIVSIGDLAVERDRQSALGEISAAAPNN